MLCVATAGKIRRARFREGRSIKAISRDLEVSHATVRKVLRSGAMEFAHEHRTTPPSTSSPEDAPKILGIVLRSCGMRPRAPPNPTIRESAVELACIAGFQASKRQSFPGVLDLWAAWKIFARTSPSIEQ